MDPSVSGFYRHIMDDVLRKTRESILIGMDEQTLDMTVERLLSLWENKLVRLGAESQTSSNEPPPLPLINDAPAKVKKTTNVPLKHMPAPAPYGGFAQDGKAANPYEDILPDRSAVNMKKETKPTVIASSSSVAAPIPVVKDSPKSVPVSAPAPAPAEPAVPSATTGRQVKAAVVGRQVKTAPVSNAGKKRGAEAEPEAPQPNSKKSKKVVEEEEEEEDGDDDHESDLGSDLDDDDDREPETDNVLLCQYTKVMRTKNRWKINVKDAILRVRGKDYLFKEVTGEFNF